MSLHLPAGLIDVATTELLAGLDGLGVSVMVTDLAGKILLWSDSSTSLFGWPASGVLGRQSSDVTSWGLPQSDAAALLLTSAGHSWTGESEVGTASGHTVRVRIAASLAGPNRELVISLASRIPRATATGHPDRANGELLPWPDDSADARVPAPTRDPLTGLTTRASLMGQLASSGPDSRDTGLAVLLVDIDGFRLVNDNCGHAAGDALLLAVVDRLKANCRDSDTLARFGDDEFVLLRPGAAADQARRLAEDIRHSFEEPLDREAGPIPFSVSIGIATTAEVPASDLLQSADRALTCAKSSGRGRIEVHNRTMRCSTEGRLQLLTDLRQAIADDSLDVHYQPIVHTDGRFVGVEALLRWRHPQHGDVSPAHIVPLAEANGLMPTLGAWILDRACSDVASNRHAGIAGMHLAVNLSPRQVADPTIVDTVRAALRRSRLPAHRLVLEVTETSVIDNPEATSRQLRALKELGLRLALDDFGTGYSSLVHVRWFPVDIIKIDRTFIAGMLTNDHDLAIVASLTNLAAAVGLDVVAEGVETAEQADVLRRLGCTYTQGYHWSPAVPIDELARLMPPAAQRHGRLPAADPAQAYELACGNVGRIAALRRTGASPSSIAAALNDEGRRTSSGTRWNLTSVARVLADNAAPVSRAAGA